MQTQISVLDHGFVKLMNVSGPVRRTYTEVFDESLSGVDIQKRLFDADDRDPAMVARICFDNLNQERTAEMDFKLCDYLMRNKHTSPFEMIEIWLEMKLPIFVARQFVRHRTCTINEVSARYSTLPAEWYIPEIVGGKATNGAKQGQEDILTEYEQSTFKEALEDHCREGYKKYTVALNRGIAPEHARMFLSLNHYTHWIWKQDLHNMLHFLSLRLHDHAQIEARVYAKAIYDLLEQVLPKTMELFREYRILPGTSILDKSKGE